MKIAIGSDHAGYRYKGLLIAALKERGHDVTDHGTHSADAVDYPMYIRPVAEAVARGDADRGIVLGGSGNGEAIVANRVRGVRCALCWNVESAKLGRQHNDANCISLGERMIPEGELLKILDTWLTTPFDGGRHQKRIDQIDEGTVAAESRVLDPKGSAA
jgi:ribose 5-phosphate isomerase B